MLNHLRSIYTATGGWRQVAALLADHGPPLTGAMWRMISVGERAATLDETNTVLRAVGEPEITQTPAEAVAASGVEHVVRLAKRPNIALLVAAAGDVCDVRVKTGVLPVGEVPHISVTLGYTPVAARSKGLNSFTCSLPFFTAEELKTKRGHSGNLAAIAAALSEAAGILNEGLWI